MMFQPLIFCFNCKKAVETDNDRCPECGFKLKERQEQKIFLSGRGTSGNSPVHLTLGTILMDRYEIVRFLGNGRYGSVYLAKDHLRSMEVALKIIDIGPLGNDRSTLRSRLEAKAYNRIIDFSYIIKLWDTHTVPWGATGFLLLSMEFADGGTFREWLMKHQENLETRADVGLDYFKQACKGVLMLHKTNAIHLDLKPENLLFSGGKLKISDLGAAMCDEGRQGPNDLPNQKNPVFEGTPRYMAPECFDSRGTGIDQRSDIYSLGVILYELLHPKGHSPFEGTCRQAHDLQFLASIPQLPEIGVKLSDTIRRCLAKDPENRYQSIADFLNDLDDKVIPDITENAFSPVSQTAAFSQVEDVWQKASLYFSEAKFKDASRSINEVLTLQPGHSGALTLKEELNDRFRQADQLYQEILRRMENGDLNELVDLMKAAVSIYPEHPSGVLVQTRLLANVKRYRESIKVGMLALRERQWDMALRYFSEASAANPGAIQLKPMIEQLSQLEGARKRADIALMNENFAEARRLACFIDAAADQIFCRIDISQ